MKNEVIDIFCGIGGLSYGFKLEGFDVVAGLDSDPSCGYAFRENVGANFIASDITQVSASSIRQQFSKAKNGRRILVGCAPCTPFSIYVGKYRKSPRNDEKWHLLREFSRIALALRPDVISMENVPRLVKHSIFQAFLKDLRNAGYSVSYSIVRAHHYGVPQRRSRLVLLASLHGIVELPPPTHENRPMTVRDAIGDLPRIAPGKAHKADRLHVSRNLTELNLKRLKATKEGGGWCDWDKALHLKCHRKSRGKSFRSVYGRMRWDAPSPVITTQCLGIGNGRFGHPNQDRAISIREAALLQSFPRRYKFVAPSERVSGEMLARQIGNAVPVKLARVIARAIRNHLTGLSRDCR